VAPNALRLREGSGSGAQRGLDDDLTIFIDGPGGDETKPQVELLGTRISGNIRRVEADDARSAPDMANDILDHPSTESGLVACRWRFA
jgi:hypothetical protein